MEKWEINQRTGQIEKRVIGLCPLISAQSKEVQSSKFKVQAQKSDTVRYSLIYKPLFWIMFDTLDRSQKLKVKSQKISERIQYDVTIKNPSSNAEWWDNNIETSKRDGLTDIIINIAYAGKGRTMIILTRL